MGAGSPSSDGRVARGERSRRQIAEALISLLEDGEAQPTARRVAERAGVSLRLVFHHFEDMEALMRAAIAVQVERHWSALVPVDPTLTLDARVEAVVGQRAELYEHIAPVRRAAGLWEPTSQTLRTQLGAARKAQRSELRTLFAAEVEDEETLDAVELATSFETWDQLRRRMGRSRPATTRAMAGLLRGALAAQPIGTAVTGGTP